MEAKPTTFMASKYDADFSMPVHQIPSHCRSKNLFKLGMVERTRCRNTTALGIPMVPALAAGILRRLVLARTDYGWLSRQIRPSEGDHLLINNDGPRTSIASAHMQRNTALTSASALAATPFQLTNTHVKQSRRFNRSAKDECTI